MVVVPSDGMLVEFIDKLSPERIANRVRNRIHFARLQPLFLTGTADPPFFIRVFIIFGGIPYGNRWSTNLCKNNPFVFGNKLTFTR